MIDFTPVRNKVLTMNEFAASLNISDLRRLTEYSVDRMLALLADANDVAVVFAATEEPAHDPTLGEPLDQVLAGTIAHIVVHATASAEEYAVLAAELARGVLITVAHAVKCPGRR
jgi:hypothetical protein